MGDWRVEFFNTGLRNGEPDFIMENGPVAIDLVFRAEEYLRLHGRPGALGRVRYEGDSKVHHFIRLDSDGEIVIENTEFAKWPIYEVVFPEDFKSMQGIPDDKSGDDDAKDFGGDDSMRMDGEDESEGESENDSDSGGEGDDDVLTRIFGRFFDGKRWRKAAVGDPKGIRQVQRASFGVIVESEVESEGDEFRPRARQEQARVVFTHNPAKPHENRMVISLPYSEGVKVDTDMPGRITVVIPVDTKT